VNVTVVGGVTATVNALSASELGTAMPKPEGSYYDVDHALGPLFGSVAGWGNWTGLAFASAFYTLGFGEYLATLPRFPPSHCARRAVRVPDRGTAGGPDVHRRQLRRRQGDG
jgi:amino acid transporter